MSSNSPPAFYCRSALCWTNLVDLLAFGQHKGILWSYRPQCCFLCWMQLL